MPWFKVDDRFAFHPKAIAAGNAALGLWVRAGSYCAAHLTDGFVPKSIIPTLGGRPRDVQKLVSAGLWEPSISQGSATDQPSISQGSAEGWPESGTQLRPTVEGWQFRNWHEFQPSKAQVEAERKANAERVAAWRERQRNARSNAVTNGGTNKGVTGAPTRPDPTNKKEPPVVPPDDDAPKRTKGTGRKRPAKALPEDWTPTASHVAKARELGVDGPREEAKFRAHAAANDRRQVDWNQAFTQWLLNAKPGNVRPLPQKVSGHDEWMYNR